ncbi:cytochrome P450 4C1 [Culex quinquefasciatus]|uniref:Cytochrome P450 4C1 n=1 Tax=Culex quinquefasciatus TaxID=7176 RepID=B0X6X9_CULQU|nr:cytochrome P450 4C1 [Culex quinquefasciatus]|eukprot:XP_001865401.1 cytochrome P450 4C1 [Culex quinquefasciatus]
MTFKRLFRFHWHFEWIYRLTKEYKKDMELRTEAYTFGDEIMRKAAERHAQELSLSAEVDTNNNRKLQIFMDQMLDKFENVEIVDNFYTMLVAGSDTSGTQMTYIALALAVYQEYQEKVYQEICSVYPLDQELNITADSLQQLQYTEMFLKECMRLLTVGPALVRKNLATVDLGDIKVPPGNTLILSVYNLHRRKDIWGPNADQFDPENFSPERSAGRHPYAFIPFSAGNRNCPDLRPCSKPKAIQSFEQSEE